MNYVFGFALIGFLGWFTYRQISLIVKAVKQKKADKKALDEQAEKQETDNETTKTKPKN